MAELVDRVDEVAALRRHAANPPALVVLRGRRRVGKTFLLRTALRGKRVIHFQAEVQPKALQLESFARECAGLIPGSPRLAFDDWSEAFTLLESIATTPLVVSLDEFPYLAAADPSLPSLVQRMWDRWDAAGTPVTLVLCGSALGFMESLVSGAAPMFGRATYRPLLRPLALRHVSAFGPRAATPAAIIERFGVLGGTPQYQRWAGTRTLGRVLTETILPVDAPLHSEPEHLIRSEDAIREPGPYFGTLQAIAQGATTTTSVAARLEMKQPLASQFLARLQDLGYVEHVEPVEPGGGRASRGYWRIGDPYFRFWFRFVLPNRSRLARGRIDEVAAEIQRDLRTFTGPVFEDACRAWVGETSSLGARAVAVGKWWSRRSDIEIDVATVIKRGYGVLGSCKWTERPVGENVLEELIRARQALGPPASKARLALFAREGFTDALRRRARRGDVTLVTAADLLA